MRLSSIALGLLAASGLAPSRPVRRSAGDISRKQRLLETTPRARPNTSRPHTVKHNGTAFVYPGKRIPT